MNGMRMRIERTPLQSSPGWRSAQWGPRSCWRRRRSSSSSPSACLSRQNGKKKKKTIAKQCEAE
jgi:hypothetical protein